jgi:hypothetical protein
VCSSTTQSWVAAHRRWVWGQHECAVHEEGGWLVHGGHRCAHRRRGAGRRNTECRVGAAQVAMMQMTGHMFPSRIRLPLQQTSLGLCEPPLGAFSSSRAVMPEDLAVLLGGNKTE